MSKDDEVVRPTISETPESEVRGAPSGSGASQPYSSTLSALVRLAWLLVLPLVILVHLGWLTANDGQLGDLPSLTFWVAVALLVLARFVDVAHLKGETADGGPATMSDFRRFVVTSLGFWGAAWTLVHLV